MCTFITANAQAPKKRVAASHQNGADWTASARVHPAGAVGAGHARSPSPGRRWNAFSGRTIARSSAAQTRSVARQPSADTSACPSGMKQNAPKPVPRSATAIARPRAPGYQSAATIMFAWLPSAARARPPSPP